MSRLAYEEPLENQRAASVGEVDGVRAHRLSAREHQRASVGHGDIAGEGFKGYGLIVYCRSSRHDLCRQGHAQCQGE